MLWTLISSWNSNIQLLFLNWSRYPKFCLHESSQCESALHLHNSMNGKSSLDPFLSKLETQKAHMKCLHEWLSEKERRWARRPLHTTMRHDAPLFFLPWKFSLSLSLEDGLWHHRAQREATKHVHHEWIKLHLFHTSCCWKLIYIFEEEKLLCWGGFSQDEWAPIFSKIPCWVMMNFSIFWNLFCQTFVEDSIRIAISASLLLKILLCSRVTYGTEVK